MGCGNRYCRTGDHLPGGLLAVAGEGVRPGAVERTLSILDLAPTFLSWFDLEPAADEMDGQAFG